MKKKRIQREVSAIMALSPQQLTSIQKDFGLTKIELNYFLTLGRKYRRNSNNLFKKLLLN